jgi:single-stranded-DNA-specific exonuclease
MKKRWTLRTTDESKAKTLHEELNISEILCGILVQRGMEHFEDARNFFRPQLDQLHVPWLMKDMEKAVERTIQAFTRLEKILVFGDYDVDGTTSVACMYRFLCSVYDKNNIDFYIPHRYREGYGISGAGIDFAKENGYTLIIALDCGIKSIELVAYARSLDIDFIICDHHLPDETVPEAVAILNPKQKDCSYPFKELCGCGVGFKLISAMCEKLNLDPGVAYEYLDLVTIAIAADIVPIVGENRILAFHGLKKVNTNPNKGIAALIELSNAVTELTVNNLVFMIAPRINAAGRMDDAKKAVLLFVQDTIEDARVYAKIT